MAPVKREIVRLREETAWALRMKGCAQARIGSELGISQPAVCKILRRVERRVLAKMEVSVQAVKAKQAAQLEYIIDQSLSGWARSRERATEERVTREFDRDEYRSVETRSRTTTCTRCRDSLGDPRFLVVALQALAAERELWGLDAGAVNRHHHDETAPPPIGPHNAHTLVLTGPRVSLNGRAPEGESTRNGSA
jgi:predicted transcriptional regulator